jgi:peptidoglycan/xylan/chitin deacetylase (PgdA/CDA1 family)
MNSIIVMYHYVRDSTRSRAFSISQFHEQIKYLKKRYEILTLSEMLEHRGSKKACVLTFDDGIKDAVTNVLPILNEVKVKGIFFVPGYILEHKRVLSIQKRHLLLSHMGAENLVHELNSRLPKELEIRADPVFKADYIDDLLTCSMKWMLDFADASIIDPILDEVFIKYIGDEEAAFDNIYLSNSDMNELLSNGMELGVHGYSHKSLGTLYFKDQEIEIQNATSAIRGIIGNQSLYMSYPSGSYSPLTIRLLEKYGYKAAITINKHDNNKTTPKFELGRYDCIDSAIF